MMMGLRLTREGVSDLLFSQRFSRSLEEVFAHQIDRLMQLGLLEWVPAPSGRVLRLTRPARLLGNQVFKEFI
jgi:coproporphyrinogen III oxidase-like Fe-S oxidoreductase